MRKNHNTSLVQSGHIVEYKFSYLKLLLVFIFFTFSITTAQAITRNSPEKWAVLFLDPALRNTSFTTVRDYVSMSIPMNEDIKWYWKQGYKVDIKFGDKEAVIRAILDDRVKSISYYGHGGGYNPTFAGLYHYEWKELITEALYKQYLPKYGEKEAKKLAHSQSYNFGLRDVTNRSCGSLYNTSLADLFVYPGDSYYGVIAENYYPCNPFIALFNKENDFILSEYKSQGPSSANKYSKNDINCPPRGPSGKSTWEGDKHKQNGSHCLYHQNGYLSQETPYANGKRNGMMRNYYKNRTRSQVIPYLNGKIHGVKFSLWKNGKYKSVLHYDHGKKLGEYRTWYEDGRPSACFEYRSDGSRIKCRL